MYAWKCWRDSRLRFIAYLTVVVALPINVVLTPALRYQGEAGWALLRDSSSIFAKEITHSAFAGFAGLGLLLIALASMAMGASGVGDEFKHGSLEFLLTRPRRRKHFIWVAWGIGALQMMAMIALSAVVVFSLVYYLTRGMALWRLFGMAGVLLVAALVCLGLSYFGTVWIRDARNGLAIAVVAALAYAIVSALLETKWRIQLPSFIDLLRSVADRDRPFKFELLAGWIAFALACPLLAQWVFDRRDV